MSRTDIYSGGIAGLASIVVGHPFDTIKIHLQTEPHKYKTTYKAIKIILKEHGVKGFFRGVLPPGIGQIIISSLFFGIYSKLLVLSRQLLNHKKSKLTSTYLAGQMTGIFLSFIISPLDLIKSKIQTGLYNTNKDCINSIVKNTGIKGLFSGFTSTCFREALRFGAYFSSYDYIRAKSGDSLYAIINAGGFAGAISWLVSYPIDVIKTKLQSLPVYPNPGNDQYKGIKDCVKQTYRAEGLNGFFKGVFVCCFRSYPVNAIFFLSYEVSKMIFKSYQFTSQI